ncbi:protein indeterminate-domain 12 isoform X2 [Malania oleifera]|nr:protein indeterminate-domain 12 isoform X2 [Malania oleifera]
MSNSTSLSEEAASTVSSGTRLVHDLGSLNPMVSTISPQQSLKIKKKRNLPGNPDPDAEVIALSPNTLLATNRFVCEICNKGFQRDQNLQLHRRGHNLPWKLKQRNSKENRKRAYVCPEPSCVHHHPSRALGDLTGIKKHFCRKHGEKKWKCEKCSKIYAVQSDWKAHSKTCGTREYRCDCGTLFSRKDSFITHRAFCDALAEESARLSASALATANHPLHLHSQNAPPPPLFLFSTQTHFPAQPTQAPLPPWVDLTQNPSPTPNPIKIKPETHHPQLPPPMSSPFYQEPPKISLLTSSFHDLQGSTQPTSHGAPSAHLSATALLQKAASVGATSINKGPTQSQSAGHITTARLNAGELKTVSHASFGISPGYLESLATWQKNDRLTRDFLGLTGDNCCSGNGDGDDVNVSMNVRDLLTFTGDVEFQEYERDMSLLKPQSFSVADQRASKTWDDR